MNLELWQFISGIIFTVGGAIVSAIWAVARINTTLQVIEKRVEILEEYKHESETSKDEALRLLAVLEERTKAILDRLNKIEKSK